MALTPAEKQRRYRERLKENQAKREEYLRKMRERARKRRELKIDKSIKDLSKRDQRRQRKKWRERQRRSRDKRRNLQRQLLDNTPPPSPQPQDNLQHHNTIRGRKKLRRDRTASYRRIHSLEKELDNAKKKINKYKSRIHRLKRTNKEVKTFEDSPRKKLNEELGPIVVPEPIKRKMLFQSTLLHEIRLSYKNCQNEQVKQSLAKAVNSKYIRKYRFLVDAKRELGFWANSKKNLSRRNRQRKFATKIRDFYSRDDNTTQTPGKKQTVTFRGVKRQKRLLVENLSILHEKFCQEFNEKVSFATFCRLRPFWVVRAKLTDRDSCLCKKHDNLQKKLNILDREKVTNEKNLEALCKVVNCDTKSLQCMTNNCKDCKDKNAVNIEVSDDKMVKWYFWKTVREDIEKNGKKMQVTKTVQSEEEGKLTELIDMFNQQFKQEFCKHVFRIRHQFVQTQKCKSELCYEEAAVHVDFSENYSCKLSSEIQSMHFGASHDQATLHTVVVYFENEENKTYCTVSNSRRHDPSAIWTHLTPILNELRDRNIDTVHFFSDGPTSQYKNKDNIFFFTTYFHKLGFKYGTWNYSEASHGKGAPDGVGAAIKRISDNLVAKGTDIANAQQLFENVKERTSVSMHFIEETSIRQMDEEKGGVQAQKIVGITKIHQVISKEKENCIYTREYSCFCKKLPAIDHNCFDLKTMSFLKNNNSAMEDNAPVPSPVPSISECALTNVNDWVIVLYENQLYPGIITNIDSDNGEYEVKTLKQVGENKYVWPRVEDRIWYKNPDVVFRNVSAPANVSRRILSLQDKDWKSINERC